MSCGKSPRRLFWVGAPRAGQYLRLFGRVSWSDGFVDERLVEWEGTAASGCARAYRTIVAFGFDRVSFGSFAGARLAGLGERARFAVKPIPQGMDFVDRCSALVLRLSSISSIST